MTRRFSQGDATHRKVVMLEVRGSSLAVTRVKPDGTSERHEQALPSEAAARTAADKLAAELSSRGYHEHAAKKPAPAAVVNGTTAAKPKPTAPTIEPAAEPRGLFDDLEAVASSAAPLPRLAPAAATAIDAPKKKTGKKKKRRKAAANPDALDKRVLSAVAAVGLLLVGGAGYMLYDMFLKPPSIVGVWKGSMVEHEIGRSLSHTAYSLTLDGSKRASMSIDAENLGSGGYRVKGNRLTLKLKNEEGEETERQFKFKLGRAVLSLSDPNSDKLLVDLVRQFHEPDSPAAGKAKAAAAAKELADDGDKTVNPDADKTLASVELSAKDGAFRLRHPAGWTAQTGGKADNTYSYILLDKDPAKITVYADVAGSLLSGADSANPGDFEEGSPYAPVHKAHEHYAKSGTGDLDGYRESPPEVFKDSGFGEGRMSVFTASAGLFGGRLKGYHATVMNRDRRISVLAYGPAEDFPKLRATYLAVCRSLGP